MRDAVARATRALGRVASTMVRAPARVIGSVSRRARGVRTSADEASRDGDGAWAVFGLGNPGKKFDGTKHNVGFDVIDVLASALGVEVTAKKHAALVGTWASGDARAVLVKPQTFMNLSGKSVRAIMRAHKIPKSRVVIVYDDLETNLGEIRLKVSGTHGGHNGIRSIIDDALGGARDFARVKVGIGRPKSDDVPVYEYVLSKFDVDDADKMRDAVADAVEAVRAVLTENRFEDVMMRVNTKFAPKKVKPPKKPKAPKERVFVTATVDENEHVELTLDVRPTNHAHQKKPQQPRQEELAESAAGPK